MTRQYINYNSVNSLLFLVVSMAAMAVLLKGYYFVIAFLLEMSAFLATLYLEARSARNKKLDSTMSALVSSLQRIKTLLINSKLPVRTVIGRIASSTSDKELASVLVEVRYRMRAGQDFALAVRSSEIPNAVIRNALLQIAEAYSSNFDVVLAFKDAYYSLQNAYLDKMEKFYSSIQKYTSLSMVAGTIVPSFALFSIVGYSILNTSAADTFFPVILFVVVLPFAFSSLKLLYADPYE